MTKDEITQATGIKVEGLLRSGRAAEDSDAEGHAFKRTAIEDADLGPEAGRRIPDTDEGQDTEGHPFKVR